MDKRHGLPATFVDFDSIEERMAPHRTKCASLAAEMVKTI
jgi:hypothetical protein